MAGGFVLLGWMNGLQPGVGLRLRLYLAPLDPTVPHVLTDFEEASFPGYTPRDQTVFGDFQLNGNNGCMMTSAWVTQQVTAECTPPQQVGGWYLTAVFPDGTIELVCWGQFEQTVLCETPGLAFAFYVVVLSNLQAI